MVQKINLLSYLLHLFLAKVVIAPISNLVRSAEKATKGEREKFLGPGKKKNEINDLVVAFDSINNELKVLLLLLPRIFRL